MPTIYDDQKQDTDEKFDDIARRYYDDEFNSIAGREKAGTTEGGKKGLNPDQIDQKEKQGNPSHTSDMANKLGTAASAAGTVAAPEVAAVGKVAKLNKASKFFSRIRGGKKNKKSIAGVVIAGGVALAVVLFVWTLLPNHLNAVLNFYDSRALRTVVKNLDDSAENFWEHYIRHYVLKSLGPGCPDTRKDISCVPKLGGKDPVSKAINALIGANSERKFFERTGILFARDNQGRLYMTGPGLPNGGIDLKDFADGKTTLFGSLSPVKQSQARQALKNALAEQTLFRRAFIRFQYRDVFKKYAVLRCVVACQAREERRDRAELRKNAFKNYFFQRVLDPRNEGMRPALNCLFDPGCEPNKVVDYNGPGGAARTEFQVEIQNLRTELIAKGANEKRISQIAKRAELYYKTGGKNYISQLILGEIVGKKLNQTIPVYGWVVFAAEVVENLKNASPKLKHMNYVLMSADMVAMYALYRTVADEGKAGRVDAETMGSFSESLTSRVEDENGNRSNAEATPLYENLLSQKGSATALFDPSPNTYAATDDGGRFYRCNDDRPVEAGFLVCAEEYLRRGFAIVDDISAIIPDALAAVASGVNAVNGFIFGWVTGPIGDFLAHLGKWVGLDALLEELSRDVMVVVRDYLFPSPVSGKTSGGRNGNVAVGGAVLVANEAAHYKMGGQVLSVPEYNDLQRAAIEEEQISFSNKPLTERLFDKENPNSLVSRMALAMPGDLQMSLRDTFANIIINPFTKIMQGLASIFTMRLAAADIVPQANPWGATTYGWRSTDPIFDANPEEYWNANCADGKTTENWHKSAELNPETWQLENTTTNGCLLIQSTAESLGARYEPTVKDEQP